MEPAMNSLSPVEMAARRRKLHANAWRLAAFAFVVYVGFIVAFINRH
jgi:hypothetical protein